MKKYLSIKIIDRYIMKEFFGLFIAGVAVIVVIMLSNFLFQLADMIVVEDVSKIVVLKLLYYKLPETVVQTFPIAILFAVMVGMGRLSSDNEFVAIRMGGVSLYRFIVPLLILGILISIMTYYFNEQIVPWSNRRAENIIQQSILETTVPEIKDNVFFKGPNDNRLFYVKHYSKHSSILKKIVILDYASTKIYPKMITAETGTITKTGWQLRNGIIHIYNKNGHSVSEREFNRMDIKIVQSNQMDNSFTDQKTPSEMNRAELKKEINILKDSGLQVDSLLVDYHLKLAKPFIALIFILIGTPLSLITKSNRALNTVLTVIIMFLYYITLSLVRSLGRNEFLPTLMAAWLPNIIFGLIGLILLIWKEEFYKLLSKFNLFSS
ncbi:LptF/LptG family permease [Selenihalanaerobacter shriftii]|uniref:Lipopolysaccharide export system permease protein n=1 Tax=Selenihalanaerobacter shriftii TaxID=142842 RepID=A0A1T4MA37_9FIRM|nr:LptF/LptG family permease [Selenihalanaerobacter shriftii]SJZ63726.1 lipopolysaccharide export system permease protein [Selenihalanaerobacter shriftii]